MWESLRIGITRAASDHTSIDMPWSRVPGCKSSQTADAYQPRSSGEPGPHIHTTAAPSGSQADRARSLGHGLLLLLLVADTHMIEARALPDWLDAYTSTFLFPIPISRKRASACRKVPADAGQGGSGGLEC